MGAWGELALDNDAACDWASDLTETDDLSLIESAIAEVESVGSAYLDQSLACEALAACEVVARLGGRPGYQNPYTEGIDRWVAAHPIKPTLQLLHHAKAAIDRILADQSELRDLWEEAGAEEWLKSVEDPRRRVAGA